MGKPGFPIPCVRARLELGAAGAEAAIPLPLREGQALPRAGVWGNPGFPIPLREGAALPNPPTGWGYGETGFPHTTARGLHPANSLSYGQGCGETRFPHTPPPRDYVHVKYRTGLRSVIGKILAPRLTGPSLYDT